MARDISYIVFDVKVRWWTPLYLNALVLFCTTFNTRPNIKRVSRFIAKYGVKISVAKSC